MLTRKQYELLMFIDQRLHDSGISPSFDEMKEALGLKSKSGIHRLITGLEERGFIRRLPHRARALEILKWPENRGRDATAPAPQQTPSPAMAADDRPRRAEENPFARRVTPADFRLGATASVAGANDSVSLPLYGRIAAGTPIEALRDTSASIEVPASMLGTGEHYALEVEGDSMVDAGILEGDTVLIRRSDTADNGAIVVALVDGDEVTLKRLRRRGASIALEPANKHYETRIFGPDQVEVQGSLVGLLRKY